MHGLSNKLVLLRKRFTPDSCQNASRIALSCLFNQYSTKRQSRLWNHGLSLSELPGSRHTRFENQAATEIRVFRLYRSSESTIASRRRYGFRLSSLRSFITSSGLHTPSSSTSTSVLSRRQHADLEEHIIQSVGNTFYDSCTRKSLNELNWLNKRLAISRRGDGSIAIDVLLKLPSLLHPSLPELKEQVGTLVYDRAKDWFDKNFDAESCRTIVVNVEAIAEKPVSVMAKLLDNPEDLLKELGPGLANVSHVVAVYSCKGGVGKSTVAVNLAYELKVMGGRVGLLDLDLYGPSLPVLLNPIDSRIRSSPLGKGMVYPIQHEGVKVLSLGYVNKMSGVPGSGQDNGAAIMKGPMAVKVVTQLLKSTDWGELDVLVLDLPPGTGDIQLGVLQELQLSGAVAVTSPSKLAVTDTKKGIEMFTSLGVPTLAVVQNMSYFQDETGKRHFPFGKGFTEDDVSFNSFLRQPRDCEIIQLPISVATNDANDSGQPLTITRPEFGAEKELSAYSILAKTLSNGLLEIHYGKYSSTPEGVTFGGNPDIFALESVTLSLDTSANSSPEEKQFLVRLFSDMKALQLHIAPSNLRARDPRTGDIIDDVTFLRDQNNSSLSLDPAIKVTAAKNKKSPSIVPSSVSRRGRYGFAVVWQDGATIIYSKQCIAKCAGGTLTA